jgi:hypothetical protein
MTKEDRHPSLSTGFSKGAFPKGPIKSRGGFEQNWYIYTSTKVSGGPISVGKFASPSIEIQSSEFPSGQIITNSMSRKNCSLFRHANAPLQHFNDFVIRTKERVVKRRPVNPPASLADCTQAARADFPNSYDGYRQLDLRFVASEPEAFQGICRYIIFHSGCCYNTRELHIAYSAIQPNSDPGNLLDYQSPQCFEAGNDRGHCILLTFRRIAIRPTGIAVRFGPPASRPPWAYLLEGWHAGHQQWVVITEHGLCTRAPGSFFVDAVDTELEFSRFRFTHLDGTPMTHFTLSGFEIHGRIRVVDQPRVPKFNPRESASRDGR